MEHPKNKHPTFEVCTESFGERLGGWRRWSCAAHGFSAFFVGRLSFFEETARECQN